MCCMDEFLTYISRLGNGPKIAEIRIDDCLCRLSLRSQFGEDGVSDIVVSFEETDCNETRRILQYFTTNDVDVVILACSQRSPYPTPTNANWGITCLPQQNSFLNDVACIQAEKNENCHFLCLLSTEYTANGNWSTILNHPRVCRVTSCDNHEIFATSYLLLHPFCDHPRILGQNVCDRRYLTALRVEKGLESIFATEPVYPSVATGPGDPDELEPDNQADWNKCPGCRRRRAHTDSQSTIEFQANVVSL